MIEINDLIGKPFAAEPDKAYGPDFYSCYGLIWEVYRRFGITIPKTNIAVTACKQASNREIEEHAAKYWRPIDKPRMPCAVLIRSMNPDFADHIGVYIGSGKMLHITLNTNVTVVWIEWWKRKIIGYYEFIGQD